MRRWRWHATSRRASVAWNAAIIAGVAYVVFIGLVQYLLPPINEVPENFSAMVLWRFRTTSLGMHVILWATLGIVFGILAERRLAPKTLARPSGVSLREMKGLRVSAGAPFADVMKNAGLLILLVLACAVFGGDAMAHSRSAAGSHAGIPIPEISHGEMAVMADYRDQIIDLASQATDTNEPFRRVLNYAQIQYSYCLWGRMPGSVTDEQSPFNECAHAYLAATKAVLIAMREHAARSGGRFGDHFRCRCRNGAARAFADHLPFQRRGVQHGGCRAPALELRFRSIRPAWRRYRGSLPFFSAYSSRLGGCFALSRPNSAARATGRRTCGTRSFPRSRPGRRQ